jgi:hypothetical protein
MHNLYAIFYVDETEGDVRNTSLSSYLFFREMPFYLGLAPGLFLRCTADLLEHEGGRSKELGAGTRAVLGADPLPSSLLGAGTRAVPFYRRGWDGVVVRAGRISMVGGGWHVMGWIRGFGGMEWAGLFI